MCYVRRSMQTNKRLLLPGMIMAALACSRGASAQPIPVTNGDGFDTHLFRPAMDSKGFFATNGTDILGANDFSLGLVIDYGRNLLRVKDAGQPSPQLINHQFQGTFHFDYGVANLLLVGVSMPINLSAGSAQFDNRVPAQATVNPAQWSPNTFDSQTLGFLALHGKLRLLRVEQGFGLALATQIGVPITNAPRYAGADPGFFVWPQLIAEKRAGASGAFKVGANVGFRAHSASKTQLDLRDGRFVDGQRLTYGLGMSLRVLEPVDLVVDTYGTFLLSEASGALKPSNEVTGGFKIFLEKNSFLMLGAGPRYTKGVEAADVRAFVGFVFEPTIGDRDGDGIKDDVDRCIDVPEDFDGDEDEDGCPEPDNDNDGIPDTRDLCPNEPETFNNFQDEDGCPDRGNVIVEDNKIIILKKIQFKRDSADILPESNEILDAVAGTMKDHPEFLLVEVGGHADERATERYNLQLTQARVDSVVTALVARGVDRARLHSVGYGEYCPEDLGHNEVAWEKNRRVEFKIVKNASGPTNVVLGCKRATAKGVVFEPP